MKILYQTMSKSNNRETEQTSDVERRYVLQPIELREEGASEGSRGVTGYAALFGASSLPLEDWERGTYIERIDRDAFDGVIERSDVFAVLNHDDSRGVLARSRQGVGSLRLEVDDRGLRYSFETPHTALGDELLESLRRGDISASSFAFNVLEDNWSCDPDDDTLYRTILKVGQLYDVSPVYRPAYPDTSVALRSFKAETERLARLDAERHKHTRGDRASSDGHSAIVDETTETDNTITYNTFTL